jgi:hypothetical protein
LRDWAPLGRFDGVDRRPNNPSGSGFDSSFIYCDVQSVITALRIAVRPNSSSAEHPEYAIISVGRHNMFGHPALSTIKTLQHFG